MLCELRLRMAVGHRACFLLYTHKAGVGGEGGLSVFGLLYLPLKLCITVSSCLEAPKGKDALTRGQEYGEVLLCSVCLLHVRSMQGNWEFLQLGGGKGGWIARPSRGTMAEAPTGCSETGWKAALLLHSSGRGSIHSPAANSFSCLLEAGSLSCLVSQPACESCVSHRGSTWAADRRMKAGAR